MLNFCLDQIEISYESDSAVSYVKIRLDNVKRVSYQIKMLNSNTFPGLLKFGMRSNINDSSNYIYYYDITSMQTLTAFLKRKDLSKNEFINILLSIIDIIKSTHNYLLYDRCILLFPELIYINPQDLDISLIYLPIDKKGDINNDFKKLILDLIVNVIEFKNTESDGYLQKIIIALKKDDFHLSSFHSLLLEIKYDKKDIGSINPSNIALENNDYNSSHNIPHSNMQADFNNTIYDKKPKKTLYFKRTKRLGYLFIFILNILIAIFSILNIDRFKSLNTSSLSTLLQLIIYII